MKKFYFLFMLLFIGGVASVSAQDRVAISVSMKTGSWSLSSSPAYARQWMSDVPADPRISVTAAGGGSFSSTAVNGQVISGSANNMYNPNGDAICFFTGFSNNTYYSYRVDAPIGWHIVSTEVTFTPYGRDDAERQIGVEVSLDGENYVQANPGESQTVALGGLEDVYVTMTVRSLSTANVFAQADEFIVTLEKDPESVTALAELQAVLSQYEGSKFMTGTEPGNYNAEAVAAFNAAIKAAYDIEGNPDLDILPDAELAALYRQYAQNIVDAYNAVIASRNLVYNLTDGYYRIKSALQYYVTETDTETGTSTKVFVDKYLHSVLNGETINAQWKTPEDLDNDCVSLWKVTATEDGNYDFVSMATDARFNNVAQSANVTMSLTSENLVHIYPVATVEGTTYTNLRLSTQTGDYQYMHQGGHGGGAGVSGNLVGWAPTAAWATDGDYINFGASEWLFVPVAEDEAARIIEAYQPIKDNTMLKERYKVLLADAQANLEIAKDETKVDLITSAEQFASPYTETREGSLENLLDGNGATYWHSSWASDPGLGVHYLQVEMPEDVTVTEDIYITFTRRNGAANDHVTEWGVYGSNIDYGTTIADKSTLDSLALLSTPFTSNTETIQSAPFNSKNYKYLLFYAEGTNYNRGYWHVSEFQLSYNKPNEHSQAVAMGETYTNLENVLNAQADTELDDITLEDYAALEAAYNAFMEKFVDPTPLRELLAQLDGTTDIVVIGDQPGFWTSNAGADAFNSNYAAAVAYDAAGAYTQEQTDNYIETLTQQNENIMEGAKKVETGKWYRIRFGTEEEFEKYGWDKVAGNGTTDSETGAVLDEDMFGKYLTVSWINPDVKDAREVMDNVSAEDVGLGDNLYFDAEEDISDKALSLFRFVAVGDSAYVLQNKGTNLFLRATGTSGLVALDAHPSLFDVHAIGYGENVIAARNLLNGASQNNLHAQVANNVLVTWNAYTPGSRSGLYIEEAGDVEGDYAGDAFNVWSIEGEIAPYCFPVDITGVNSENGQMYGVAVEGETVKLFPIETANAGRPFIYIHGFNTEGYDTENEGEYTTFKHGYTFVTAPDNGEGALTGVFVETVIDRGDIYVHNNAFEVNKNSKDIQMSQVIIPANSAYITNEGEIPVGTVLELVIDEDMEDGIATVLTSVAKGGAVYTVDGRLVSKKANLNDLKKFGKGVYILNGTKVVVK